MLKPLINISPRRVLIFTGFLVLFEFLTYISNDMIMPGMIQVINSFNQPDSAIATSLTVYILGGVSLQLFLGPMSDKYGRRPVMLCGVMIFLIATIWIAFSDSMQQFLLARFLQGTGLCFMGVIGYATIQEIFAEGDAIRLVAMMANISILAPLIGPVLGAIFISYFHWRYIFILVSIFALVALWGLWRYMPEVIGQVKKDGEKIKPTSLAPSVVAKNYKRLFLNRSFLLGSIGLGLAGMPCIVWIALAPVILIAEAKCSVIEYGLWQIPVFGAAICGNWMLQGATRKYLASQILWAGSVIIVLSLMLMFLLPAITNSNYYILLMPGLICYFFGLGVMNAPLDRLILYSTPVGKGTSSALMMMVVMCFEAIGIEIANILYAGHSNLVLGLYCAITGIIYFIVVMLSFFPRHPAKIL